MVRHQRFYRLEILDAERKPCVMLPRHGCLLDMMCASVPASSLDVACGQVHQGDASRALDLHRHRGPKHSQEPGAVCGRVDKVGLRGRGLRAGGADAANHLNGGDGCSLDRDTWAALHEELRTHAPANRLFLDVRACGPASCESCRAPESTRQRMRLTLQSCSRSRRWPRHCFS